MRRCRLIPPLSLLFSPKSTILLASILLSLIPILSIYDYLSRIPKTQGTAQNDKSISLTISANSYKRGSSFYIWNIGTDKRVSLNFRNLNIPKGCKLQDNVKGIPQESIYCQIAPGSTRYHFNIPISGDAIEIQLRSVLISGSLIVEGFGKKVVTNLLPNRPYTQTVLTKTSEIYRLMKRLGILALFTFLLSVIFSFSNQSNYPQIFPKYFILGLTYPLCLANMIWYLFLPGQYTGDAYVFINSSFNTDLVAPFYQMLFNAYASIFPSKIGGVILFQIYFLYISLFCASFATAYLVGKLKKPTRVLPRSSTLIVALLTTTIIGLNPIFISTSLLLYLDHSFYSVVLFSFFFAFLASITKRNIFKTFFGLSLLMAITSLAMRHNSLFLLPGFIIIYNSLLKSQLEHKMNLFNRTVFILLIILIPTLGIKSIASHLVVKEKRNYYITVPLYEMIGVYSKYPHTQTDLALLGKYMDVKKQTQHYLKKGESFISTVYLSKHIHNLANVYKDHKLFLHTYLTTLLKYPIEYLSIKLTHFLHAVGLYKMSPAPFDCRDTMFWGYKGWKTPKELTEMGIGLITHFPRLNSYRSEISRKLQTGPYKFLTTSAFIPLIISIISVVGFYMRKNYNANVQLLVGFLLLSIIYTGSYFVASHGGSPKYGFLSYIIGSIFILCYGLSYFIDTKKRTAA